MQKKKSNRTLYIIIIIALIAFGVWYFVFKKEKQVTIVSTEKPTTGYISQSVTATGTIQPVDTVAVGTQVSGTIDKIYADFNSTVKKGELLAELDKTLFQAAVNQYIANVQQAQSQLVYQQGNYNRQKQLYDVGAISKADYDDALYTYNAAKATVGSAEAQLQSAQKNLSLASIYSPIDGTVLSRAVSVGQTVAASFSTPTLFTIAKDITKMQVKANVDEADIGNVAVGDRATFTVDAFLNDVFNGTVQEIRLSPVTSSNVVTYTTLIGADNNDKKLKPGMTANIIIYTKEVNNTMLVSAKALQYKPDSSLAKEYKIIPVKGFGAPAKQKMPSDSSSTGGIDSTVTQGYVWVKEDKQLIQKQITTGLDDNTHVQVLGGLNANDEVVTGSEVVSGKEAATANDASSPFMPHRPARSTPTKKK